MGPAGGDVQCQPRRGECEAGDRPPPVPILEQASHQSESVHNHWRWNHRTEHDCRSFLSLPAECHLHQQEYHRNCFLWGKIDDNIYNDKYLYWTLGSSWPHSDRKFGCADIPEDNVCLLGLGNVSDGMWAQVWHRPRLPPTASGSDSGHVLSVRVYAGYGLPHRSGHYTRQVRYGQIWSHISW